MHSQLANNEATEQFVRLLGFHDCNTLLGLEDFLVLEKLLLLLLFLGLCLVVKEFEKWLHFPSNFNQNLKCFPDILFHPLLLDDLQDGNDVDKVFLIVPISESGHLEVGSVRQLDLDLLGFLFLVQIYGGTYRMGGQAFNFPFLHSEFFRPSGRDLRLELMEYCQSGVSKIRCFKVDLGRTCRILCRGSAWYFADCKILIFVGGSLMDLPDGGEGLVSAAPERSLQQTPMLT
jgi:hypothetical protein